MMGYKIMRIRAKISFKSMVFSQAILQNFYQKIYDTYQAFNPEFKPEL